MVDSVCVHCCNLGHVFRVADLSCSPAGCRAGVHRQELLDVITCFLYNCGMICDVGCDVVGITFDALLVLPCSVCC